MPILRTPRLAGGVLLVTGLALVLLGALPWQDARAIGERTWPILLFLVLAAVAAELLDEVGLFDEVTHWAARLAGGRTAVLFALHLVVCTLCTVLLSLDTTAVMLTPLAITVARELAIDVLPFAFATLWLANTASLLLPVSNLTNLLAHDGLDLGVLEFAALMWRPQVVVLAATVLVLLVLFGPRLRGSYVVPHAPPTHDRRAVLASAAAVTVFVGLVVVEVVPWVAALVLLVLLLPVSRRARLDVSPRRLAFLAPWATTALALGLFLVVAAVVRHDPGGVLAALHAEATGRHGALALAAAGAGTANLVNNLPAYLALEPAATTEPLTAALLTGVNAAPLVTPWGSLATLLWLQACHRRGVHVGAGRLVGGGALLAGVVLLGVWALTAAVTP